MFGTANPFAPLIFKPGITQPNQGVPLEWSSLGQAGSCIVIAAAALIQYAAVTGPVFVPSATTPLTWQSEYPDQIPGKTFPTADQRAFASGFTPIIPTVTSWEPNFPDRTPKDTFPTAEQRAWAGPIFPITAVPTGWLGTSYPPTALGDSEIEIGRIGLVLPIEPPFSAAYYPNWFPQPSSRWNPGYEAHPVVFTATVLPPLTWKPVYPDRLDSRTFPTAEQLAYASGFVPIIPKTSWEPTFPDYIQRTPTRPWEQFWAGPISPPAPTVPPLGWLGTSYPPRPEVTVDLEMGRMVLAVPPDAPFVSVWYPDRVPGKAFYVMGGEVHPLFFAAPAFPDLSWQPIYPVQFFRAFPEGSYSTIVAAGFVPPTPPRGWAAFYPDRFPQPYVPPASGLYAPVMLIVPPPPSTDTTVIVIHRGRFRLAKSKGVVHRGEGRLIV